MNRRIHILSPAKKLHCSKRGGKNGGANKRLLAQFRQRDAELQPERR